MKWSRLVLILICICVFALSYLVYQFLSDQQRLTRADYMKIKDAMNRSEVEAILGPPTEVYVRPQGGTHVFWFGRKEGMIEAEFLETGEMVRKSYTESARNYRPGFVPGTRD